MACHGRSGAVYPVGSGTARPCGNILRPCVMPSTWPCRLAWAKSLTGRSRSCFLQADITQLAADTGFAPRTAFADGIRATIAWAKTQKQTN